jgi:hypothetical protein
MVTLAFRGYATLTTAHKMPPDAETIPARVNVA